MSKTIVYFISGANRGIGLSIAKEISKKKNVLLLATTRNLDAATELKSLPNVKVFKLDVTSKESIDAAAAEIAKVTNKIDVLISNSGISQAYTDVLHTGEDSWLSHYKTNVLGSILLFQSLYPLLKEGELKKVFFMSSLLGSIGGFLPMSCSSYGQSKAALNYTTKELSFELASEGFTVVALHPGLVSTDMGSHGIEQLSKTAPEMGNHLKSSIITPEESALGLLKVIDDSTTDDDGKFLQYNGSDGAW